jgi:hypothetical protein
VLPMVSAMSLYIRAIVLFLFVVWFDLGCGPKMVIF